MENTTVEATLRDGRVMPKYFFVLLYVIFALLLVFVILIIVAEVLYDTDNYLLALALAMPLMALPCAIWLLIYALGVKKRVNIWKADAVELDANCTRAFGTTNIGSAIKIEVTFLYNGNVLKRTSGFPSNNPQKGYSKWFNKYVDKRIKILYSPKYDEVMILKQ